MAWRRRWVSRFPLWALMIGGCTMANPEFDETRQSVADEAGSDEGKADLETGEGDIDTGDGDGDGDTGTSDTGDGDGDTGNDSPCDGLEPLVCQQTNGCVAVFYQPIETLPNDGLCVALPTYDGCLSILDCEPPPSVFWCNIEAAIYIKTELNGCIPSIVEQESLETCQAPGNNLLPC